MKAIKETDLLQDRDEKQRVPLLEAQLKAAQDLNLTLMEVTATLYEEKVQMQENQLMVMGAVADVFEMVLSMTEGGS
ncbi:hypothetical protein [Exiguobacterium sp. AT1b]|uniref:Uncharacterized protein n=1 Tax=Exiguobacterium sp. (strain ATCC BAA-1283 / AT1b) TaxID=360911 RepID=C4L140_EXISA|nr:hypothetical protein [Exiguobacterium sp. AT1b]ACQ68986.1 hypothetical protein EAT1b_0051 [Exiguobacterium sp. AT1b]